MPAPIVTIASCPTCGRAYRPRPVPVPALSDAERASLSDAQVIEYFKSTAPMKDVEFFLKCHPTPALAEQATELLALLRRQDGQPSVQTRREYARLHQAWREWRNAAARQPAIDPEDLVVADAPVR
jgi:hypothetical protein